MATRNEEEGGSRLWRGMRTLLFGEDHEATLRDQIEEAIDEAEDEPIKRGDLSPTERQMLRNLLHLLRSPAAILFPSDPPSLSTS
jgi:hypothetical protein